jgi:hypothetical protein
MPGDELSSGPYALSDDQRRSLLYSAQALKRWGWVSFWIQLALSLTSTGVLLFSVAFTSTVRSFVPLGALELAGWQCPARLEPDVGPHPERCIAMC